MRLLVIIAVTLDSAAVVRIEGYPHRHRTPFCHGLEDPVVTDCGDPLASCALQIHTRNQITSCRQLRRSDKRSTLNPSSLSEVSHG